MENIKNFINEVSYENNKLKNHPDIDKLETQGAPEDVLKVIGELQTTEKITGIDLLHVITEIYKDLK